VADLARAVTSGAVRLAAATAAWSRLVGELDEREGWAGVGIQSCAHWLAWQCGLAPGAAREHVRMARALRGLPVTAEAFAAGRLSYSKVRAITRVADPDTEVELVELAAHATASQVERVVRVLDIPWALLGAVALAVPLLAMAVTGLAVRSRLPMERRRG
jgi:hypothetical protein